METLEKKSLASRLANTNVIVILMAIALLAAVATWFIPAGQYQTVIDPVTGNEVVDADTFTYIEKTPVGPKAFLEAFHNGIVSGAWIIAFLLIIGGSFGIMNSTGAMDSLTSLILRKFKSNASKEIIICVVVTLFAFGGAVWGWALECFAFAPFLMALMVALGYDALMGVGIIAVAYNIGYHASFINPFGLGIAQEIAGVPYLSGMGLRIACFVIFDALTCLFFIMYGRKIQKDPTKSLCYGIEYDFSSSGIDPEKQIMTKKQKLILGIFTVTIILMIIGAMKWSWFITQISTLFLVMGIVMGLVYGYGVNGTANRFIDGAKDMLYASLIIGFSNSIILILEQANVLHTIIRALTLPLNKLPPIICAPFMVIIQTIINFFITSSSGQAVVAMPIMTPVADLLGVSRQVAVLAYQFGDGISDALFFTCGAVPIAIGMAKISLSKWCKFVFKFVLWMTLLSMVIVAIAQYIGY